MNTSALRHCLTIGAALLLGASGAALAQVTVAVDAAADNHPISPLIYGMNFTSAAQASAGRIPLTRWGGNSTSRYNYQIDVTNTGADYFFENIPGCWGPDFNYCAMPPKDPMASSGANAFLDGAIKGDMVALLTVPTLGWVAKAPPKYAHPFDCGCPRSALAQQDGFDPYDMNCGDGKRNGAWLNCPAPTTTSAAADATWNKGWVTYLTGKYGPANGKRIYALDNEPNLWSSTHHDVHPARLTYEELWQRMRDNAVAILDADPTAQIAGPAEWGWPNYLCSDADDISKGCSPQSPDRARHGGVELVAWLLEQARDYEKQSGRRILHYLDLHYYPMGGNSPDNTRSLWDPAYTDPSWINDKIRLIPRMRDWAAQHYPGTKLMVSEYDFGHHNDATGAITYAEVLGIFGREGLDGATAWGPPAENEAAFGAYKLYRNFDGAGGHFEATNARATVTGKGVAAFAAVGASRATVALVNEGNGASMVKVTIAGFTPSGMAHLWTGNGVSLTKQPDAAVAGGAVTVSVPGMSFAMLVIDGQGPQLPDMAMAGQGDMAQPPGADAAGMGGHDLTLGGDDGGGTIGQPATGCACRVGHDRSDGVAYWVVCGVWVLGMVRRRREIARSGGAA